MQQMQYKYALSNFRKIKFAEINSCEDFIQKTKFTKINPCEKQFFGTHENKSSQRFLNKIFASEKFLSLK